MATLLLIDSQAPRRSFLSIALEQEGHRVIEAESGDRALALMQTAQPDLVLLDLLIAPPGGHKVIRHLYRSEDPPPRLRVVFLASPYIEEEARLLARACGVSRVVPDISDTATLLRAIRESLSEALPEPQTPAAEAAEVDPLYRMVGRLYNRVAQLETMNARLERKFMRGIGQLEVARSALDEEVMIRLQTKEALLQENMRLRHEAVRDPLTGLYNRRYLEETLAREESRARRSGRPLSMMMIDIDHFKRCNDTYGHAAGDEVLRAVSRCMESLARSEDILCRYGGEEFVLIMTNTAPATLWQRANALRTGVPKLQIEYEHRRIGPITLSIGLAIYPDNGSSAHAALQAADIALYHAKNSGRDRIMPALHN